MDSYPALIPIKHVLKVSEAELKTKLHSREDKICGEAKAIMEISGLECRIFLQRRIKYKNASEEKEMLTAYLALFFIEKGVEIGTNLVFCLKSASFLKYHEAYHDRKYNSNGVDICNFPDLFDPEKKYIVDGEFVIEVKGIISLKKKEMTTTRCEHGLIRRLWKDEDERDFTIVVKDENGCKPQIKIHKVVLALRSPVFNRMFKTDMKEKEEGKVDIIDFNLDTVKSAVAFCYDQEIFEESPKLQQLVALHRFADKYDIEDLKKQTEIYFVDTISLENICAITNAVINLNAPKLQDYCFRFLLMASREEIPIKDVGKLDNGIAAELFKKSFSGDYC